MDVKDFEAQVKSERTRHIKSAYDLADASFKKLKYHEKENSDFKTDASEMIVSLRADCWDSFKALEKEFTSNMLDLLIDDPGFAATVSHMNSRDALKEFARKYPDHLYKLNLSNTQSRRTRAGKEFEAIIEMILLGAGIRLDSQANLGKKEFQDKGLGKLVDIVIPGMLEYSIAKHKTIILSSKTSLRERWAEVIEETSTTGSGHIYLATLDDSLSRENILRLVQNNIILVVLEDIKSRVYGSDPNILSFEEFIQECVQKINYWTVEKYDSDQKEIKKSSIRKQIKKHEIGRGRKKSPKHNFTHAKLFKCLIGFQIKLADSL